MRLVILAGSKKAFEKVEYYLRRNQVSGDVHKANASKWKFVLPFDPGSWEEPDVKK